MPTGTQEAYEGEMTDAAGRERQNPDRERALRALVAKAVFDIESGGGAQWPSDSERQPYCQWAYRYADKLMPTLNVAFAQPSQVEPLSADAPARRDLMITTMQQLAEAILSQKCIWDANKLDWIAPNAETHRNLSNLFARLASPAPSEERLREVLRKHYIMDDDGCRCGCGQDFRSYFDWVEHILVALRATAPSPMSATKERSDVKS
jgi:hypothetical protein